MRKRVLLDLSSLLFVVAGCTTEPGPGPGPAAAPPPPTATSAEIHAKFHFIVERNGAPVDVDKIVYTDRFATRLDGLPPGAEVTIVARTYAPGAEGRGWTSTTTFAADAAGIVDSATMAPISGSYAGVDPDGFFWSMTEGPIPEGLGVNRRAAFFKATLGDRVVAEAALGRLPMAENVRVEEVTDDGLVAEYFLPAGVTDRVPVVAFGGSDGGIYGGEFYAMRLASLGYPTLAVAYFGMKGVPQELTEIPLEYFGKAFAWLDKRAETRKGKVVVMGGSRGGELALLLGATFPSVVGVIAETPSSFRWAGLGVDGKTAWTYEGKPLAFVPPGSKELPARIDGPEGSTAWVLRTTFEESMRKASPEALEAARIAVENTRGPILMIAGAADQMWPACDFGKAAMTHLTATGHAAKHGDEAVCFPMAGHAVGGTGLPTAGSMWATIGEDVYALGGTAEANARAGRAADEKVRAFLGRAAK